MEHAVFAIYVVVTSAAFARLEIHIEGPNGWAAALPTWRVQNRWTRLLYSSRPLTGYHLWLFLFVVLMVHAPFALRFIAWSSPAEMRAASFLIGVYLFEDFLWFVMNPTFGIRRFRPEHIWWHASSWWWIMPRDYWIFLCIGAGLYVASCAGH